MNISSQISSIYESNSSHHPFSNGTTAEINFEMFSVGSLYIICIFMSFPINFYVIWLIVRGTGNGLTAEIFILNLSVCEILLCVQTFILFLAYIFQIPWIIVAFSDGLLVIGHPLFESLICVERYLAVVHPVTFLKYKPLRYRLVCSALVWATTIIFGGFNAMTSSFDFKVYLIFLIIPFLIFLFLKLFFLVAVLIALKQSGPGERGGGREEENHMKRRAFYFILVTTLSMLLIYFPYIIVIVLITPEDAIYMCVGQICFTLAGLVQPVLFLYRVGKLNLITSIILLVSSAVQV